MQNISTHSFLNTRNFEFKLIRSYLIVYSMKKLSHQNRITLVSLALSFEQTKTHFSILLHHFLPFIHKPERRKLCYIRTNRSTTYPPLDDPLAGLRNRSLYITRENCNFFKKYAFFRAHLSTNTRKTPATSIGVDSVVFETGGFVQFAIFVFTGIAAS